MSDYPKGGDIQTTRKWLDKEGFTGVFQGWKADAILGLDKDDIRDEVPGENGRKLWGFLNTARMQGSAGGARTPPIESPVAQSRKHRWDSLNAVLDINKKAKTRGDGNNSVGYTYVSWEQVKSLFPVTTGKVSNNSASKLPNALLDALFQYLGYASVCLGSLTEGHEAKRVHFIAPIVIIVCSHFNGDIQILTEEDIDGNRVHAHGHFEFVLKRGEKRICIVEAKKDDILQGKTQSLVGCESLCDVEELSVAYGIATNYLEWCFLKNEANKITEEMLTLQLEDGRPTKDSVEIIANKIISILD